MSAYHTFTSTRTTEPDLSGLTASLRASVAPETGVAVLGARIYKLKKSAAWTSGDIALAQAAIDASPAITPRLIAQHDIDAMPIFARAIVLALIDQLNVIRAALPTPLPAITPAQALASIRQKAGTL